MGYNVAQSSLNSRLSICLFLPALIGDLVASILASFGKGIAADQAAVTAALVEPWSNGQTEGQITKLKLVKRQMYGRAKLDLLRARLTAPD